MNVHDAHVITEQAVLARERARMMLARVKATQSELRRLRQRRGEAPG